MREVRRIDPFELVIADREHFAVVMGRAGRIAKSLTDIIAAVRLQSGKASGATARNSLSAPHSSDSKWENAM